VIGLTDVNAITAAAFTSKADARLNANRVAMPILSSEHRQQSTGHMRANHPPRVVYDRHFAVTATSTGKLLTTVCSRRF